MPKTFTVKCADGTSAQAEQLATFAHYLEGAQFRFVVTRLAPNFPAAVTHRHSGALVCHIPHLQAASFLGDYAAAGRAALAELVQSKGEARVAAVLRRAEQGA